MIHKDTMERANRMRLGTPGCGGRKREREEREERDGWKEGGRQRDR